MTNKTEYSIHEIEGMFYRWAAQQPEDDTPRGRLAEEIAECNRLFDLDKHPGRYKRRLHPRRMIEWEVLREEFVKCCPGIEFPERWAKGHLIDYE